jgi:hypothetical protein
MEAIVVSGGHRDDSWWLHVILLFFHGHGRRASWSVRDIYLMATSIPLLFHLFFHSSETHFREALHVL